MGGEKRGGGGLYPAIHGRVEPLVIKPQQEHPKEKPADHCFPTKKNPKTGKMEKSCECMQNEGHKGCKAGKRDVEMQNCNSWCYKEMCGCCLS